MNLLIVKIKAHIKLYKEGRKFPFGSGYRPMFKFPDSDFYTSGSIELIDSELFSPGDEGLVEITFLNKEWLGKSFGINKAFTFGEGPKPLGEGIVIEILEERLEQS